VLESSTMPASSDDESLEPLASGIASDTEEDADSDGPYAFRRKKNCDSFLAVCYLLIHIIYLAYDLQ
jgi:hypothetical protein